jgi:hypothetical protein
MKYKVIFQEGSRDDYKEAISYYEKINENLADSFYLEFWSTI